MSGNHDQNANQLSELRLFLEELCSELCFMRHVVDEALPPEAVRIHREFYLGAPGAFADIRVEPTPQPPYFVEIKYGYPSDVLLRHLRRKYGADSTQTNGASKVVLLMDAAGRADWSQLEKELPRCLRPGLSLEIWTEARFGELLEKRFGARFDSFTEEGMVNLRNAVVRALMAQAFGESADNDPSIQSLKTSLLWHLGWWRVRQILQAGNVPVRATLAPGLYPNVVILLGDLCAFSAYVRDTPDEEVVRHCLTSFYSKARYQILNHGGMLYQFVGDEVVGLFGVPDGRSGFAQDALDAAKALVDIGNSVSHHWQRHIDRIQDKGGVHIGMAIGDLQVVSVQPYGRAQMGVVGDSINLAARLMATAGSGEIVVSNTLHQQFEYDVQRSFQELEPIEARNIGRIKAWRLDAAV